MTDYVLIRHHHHPTTELNGGITYLHADHRHQAQMPTTKCETERDISADSRLSPPISREVTLTGAVVVSTGQMGSFSLKAAGGCLRVILRPLSGRG